MATRRPPVFSKLGLRRPPPLVVAANLLATTLAAVVAAAQPPHQNNWPAPRYSRPPRLEQPANLLTTTLAQVVIEPIEPAVAGEFRKRRVKLRRPIPKRPIVIEEARLPAEVLGPLPEADLGPRVAVAPASQNPTGKYASKPVKLDYGLKVDLSVPMSDRPFLLDGRMTARKKRDASPEDVMMILKVLKDMEEL